MQLRTQNQNKQSLFKQKEDIRNTHVRFLDDLSILYWVAGH